jgi:glucose dehydrogenase
MSMKERCGAFLLALLCLPVTPARAGDGDWTMPAGNYASTRFSPLTQIDASNAARLQVAFTFSTGIDR